MNDKKAWFSEWFDSNYYHVLYQHRTEEEALAFVDKLVRTFDWPNGYRLLDVACGKGRHARAFASYGLQVVGVDLSAASIQYASQFEHDHLKFFVHDMRQTLPMNGFDVVCNLFTSFGYFEHWDEHQKAAQVMASALKPGGQLLIDFVNPVYARKQIDANPEEVIQHGPITFTIQRTYTEDHYSKLIKITDKETRHQYEEKLQAFTLEQLKEIFMASGLQFKDVFGDYALSPYVEESSSRLIIRFIKSDA